MYTGLKAILFSFAFAVLVPLFAAPVSSGAVAVEKRSNLGTIKGIVRDDSGSPIADATVAIFRIGTTKVLKQVSSGRDGSFLARIIPGTYSLLAVAQGFNPVTVSTVEIGPSSEAVYGFKLERAGAGNTLPEKRADRNSSKWRIRAAQAQRSIYQNQEGDPPVAEEAVAIDAEPADDSDNEGTNGKPQAVVETYFASAGRGSYSGVNFATLVPVNADLDLTLAGQTGVGKNAPQRFETAVRFRGIDDHQIRLNTAVGIFGVPPQATERLGQVSVQALDEWRVREGIVVVFGLDYSRFFGAGDDDAFSPRLGLQLDLNSKTRLRTAFTNQTEERSWANAIELEGQTIGFVEPVAIEDMFLVSGKPRMNRSSRLEFGIERILDGRSSIDLNAFLDTTPGRGVGLNSIGFDTLDPDEMGDLVASQEGGAQGLSVVYHRRLGAFMNASAGYAFGSGQKLSADGLSDPARVFENDFFQSFFAQLVADLGNGTNVRTIYRLSPEATVFAIDPFKGRLAIYDPGLSIYITKSLPSFGLPVRAQAVVDARNLFDLRQGVSADEGVLLLNTHRRMLRGGLQVRF